MDEASNVDLSHPRPQERRRANQYFARGGFSCWPASSQAPREVPDTAQLPLLEVDLVETLLFAERSVFVSVVLRDLDPSGSVMSTVTFSSMADLPSSNFVVVVSFSFTVLVPSLASTVSRITGVIDRRRGLRRRTKSGSKMTTGKCHERQRQG
jgi:hypothetical protein